MRLSLLLLAVLTGCASPYAPPQNATSWEGRVRWIELDDDYQVRAACRELHNATLRSFNGVAGCYRTSDRVCTIITQRVEQENHFRIVGHELVHCAWGPFHDDAWKWKRQARSRDQPVHDRRNVTETSARVRAAGDR